MKKHLLIIAAAAFALLSCGENKNEQQSAELSLSNTEVSIAAEGGEATINVTSNTDWQVSKTAGWITAAPEKGNGNAAVKLTVAKNEATSTRSADVKFICAAKQVTVTVSQAAAQNDTPTPQPEPEKKVTAIKSADDFLKFAADSYDATETVTLEADITVSAPVDILLCNFDGKGHTITIDYTEAVSQKEDPTAANLGLFRQVFGAVKDLKTKGSITLSPEAGSGTYHLGGIAGLADGSASFEGCENGINLLATTKCTHHIGGIAGFLSAGGKVTSCTNTGKVEMIIPDKGASNASQLGGIVGHIEASGELTGCVNKGQVTYEGTGTPRIAGITGYVNNAEGVIFKDCTNDGAIVWNEGNYSASSWSYLGGITGYFGTPSPSACDVVYDGCVNNGNIECNVTDTYSRVRVGGIAGHAGQTKTDDGVQKFSYKNCTNNGNIASSTVFNNILGGILGYAEVSALVTCEGCTNTGKINVSAGQCTVGGILGQRCSKNSVFTNFTVTSATELAGVGEKAVIGLAFGSASELETAVTGKVAGKITKDGATTTADAGNFASMIFGAGPAEGGSAAGVTFAN